MVKPCLMCNKTITKNDSNRKIWSWSLHHSFNNGWAKNNAHNCYCVLSCWDHDPKIWMHIQYEWHCIVSGKISTGATRDGCTHADTRVRNPCRNIQTFINMWHQYHPVACPCQPISAHTSLWPNEPIKPTHDTAKYKPFFCWLEQQGLELCIQYVNYDWF